ncbi:MAG TPA: hypothetical protein VFY59_14815 [Rubrobacter sp.]|nr:hypothetical protein [Rubrobacter sp.]
MEGTPAQDNVRILAHSPGRYPILVIELPSGELRTAYLETGYDLRHTKPVDRGWLQDNAIGRHSFVALDPPVEWPVDSLADYTRNELLQKP